MIFLLFVFLKNVFIIQGVPNLASLHCDQGNHRSARRGNFKLKNWFGFQLKIEKCWFLLVEYSRDIDSFWLTANNWTYSSDC